MEEIVTGEAVVLDLPCARFPARILARLIDMAVELVLFGVIANGELFEDFPASNGEWNSPNTWVELV